ncbi:MAG: DNA polymerase III subunit gamma/tau [bacterium]|nr:DNA polymerase III subunit gamma/tau [bacterium]
MVLYRKYRPQTLAEIIGQEHIKEPLLASLKTGKISHAYLFTGPRGTGKTSVARILAKAVNCQKTAHGKQTTTFGEPCNECASCVSITEGSHLDILEIDAASNRGIDEIRDLREKIKLAPAFGRYKVYIIDEAHMLTSEAFNALLKTLEEPPEHAIFILATTEPQKIPATIASRSTRFDFKIPTTLELLEKLTKITKEEGWQLSRESLEEIAKIAGGAFRDAEVLLEKVASYDSAATIEKTRQVLGKIEARVTTNLLRLIQEGKTREALLWLDAYVKEGGSIRVLAEAILEVLRKLLLIKAGAAEIIGSITEEELEILKNMEKSLSKVQILKINDLFNKAIVDLRDVTIAQLPIEIAIIEATLENPNNPVEIEEKSNDVTHNKINEPVIKDKVSVEEALEKNGEKEDQKKKIETEKIGEALPTPKKSTGQDSKILKNLQSGWGKFLKEIKPLNSSLEMFLRSAKPVDIDEDTLVLEFSYRFHKEKIEEKKYREVIEKALEKFTGSPLRLKGIVSPKAPEVKKEQVPKLTENVEEVDPAQIFGKLE